LAVKVLLDVLKAILQCDLETAVWLVVGVQVVDQAPAVVIRTAAVFTFEIEIKAVE